MKRARAGKLSAVSYRLSARGAKRAASLMAVLLVVFLAGRASAAAQASAPLSNAVEIKQVMIGFGGVYKLGYWTPLTVTVTGLPEHSDAMLEVIVPDSDGVPTRVRCPIVSYGGDALPGVVTSQLLVKIGRNSGEISVAVIAGERTLTHRAFDLAGGELPAALAPDAFLVLALGKTRHLAETIGQDHGFTFAGGRVVTVSDWRELPQAWYGYEGVDVVLVAGSAEATSHILSHANKRASLNNWLRRGGRVIMTVGAEADAVLAAGSPLAEWAPGKFERVLPLTTAAALERVSGVESPLESLTEGDPLRLDVARLVDVQGTVLAHAQGRSSDLPLIVQHNAGFGRVAFIAVDLDEPLFGRWSGTGPLLTGLFLPRRVGGQADSSSASGEVTHAGYDDLSGQLRSALDQFKDQGVALLPFGMLFSILLGYIVLLGPGDYFFLKRLLKRMEATWITLPLLIVATCGGAYALAVSLKGNQLHVNQVDVVDYDEVAATRRATTWFTIFSPRGQAYNLSLAPQTAATGVKINVAAQGDDVLLSWFGLPGTALGGMESRSAPSLGGRPYDYSPPLSSLSEVPIPIWSTKSFVARWSPQGEPPVAAALEYATGRLTGVLRGSLTNRARKSLESCVLLTNRWAYPVGTLKPGQTLQISDEMEPRLLESYLVRRRDIAEQYDRYDLDIPRILEMMSFYEGSGGRDFTRLKHRYEGSIDISSLLSDGQAVLIGVTHDPAATVLNGNEPLTQTDQGRTAIYRVVLPVARRAAEE